jgi:vitamin B12 transporter
MTIGRIARRWFAGGLFLAFAMGAGVMTAEPARAARVEGVVVDRTGQPVEYATVAVPALKRGAATDERGAFALELPPGPTVLEVSQIGYEHARVTITVAEGMPALRVELHDEPVPLAEVTVATSAFGKSGSSEGAVVRRIDIMTTPGGAADIFQSLRALPGLNAPNDGAALYVRGGDPHETLIRLDSGEIGHPYHWEGASGGLFSAIDTYMIESAFFSSGGFSTKYGGALSGVLDIQTEDLKNLKTVSIGANLAGETVSSTWALVPDKLSFVGSVARSAPGVLFKLYGAPRDYESAPTSVNGVGKLLFRYSQTGRISGLYLASGDQVAVNSQTLNTESVYSQHSNVRLASLQFRDVLAGRIALRGQLSSQWYGSHWSFGPTGAARTERNAEANLDAVWPIGNRHELSFGVNGRHFDTEIVGRFAADSTDFMPGAPTREQVSRPVVDYPGVYLEDKLRVWGPLYATLGSRFDWASTPGTWTSDPRGALAWRVDDHQTLRIAAGRYHQLADPRFLDPVYGNPQLAPLAADHTIAGYEWKTDVANVRVEAYHKEYRGLVTNDAATYYANAGRGYARGIDVFTQGTHGSLTGWVSYGYLDSKRLELDDPHLVRSRYGTGHAVTLVTRYQLNSRWQVGGKYNYAAGRPVTPVVDRTFDATRGIWHPVYGEHNSERLPDYHRLDVRITRLFSLPSAAGLKASSVCVLYVEAMNVLGLHNVQDYAWNSDYTERRPIDSVFSRRLLVAGVSLSW